MTLVDVFTSLADKIRSKLGTTDKYSPISAIEAIDDVYTKGYDNGFDDAYVPTQTKEVTASTGGSLSVMPDDGYTLSEVSVYPTPSQTKSAKPSTSAQTITPDNGKLLSSVSISAIETETKTQAAGTSNVDVTPTSGKYLTKVTVTPTPTQEKTVTATTSAQTVTPDSGKHLSKVTVNAQSHSGTYTFAANDTGNTKDLGTAHDYRYVNASNVYAKGKADEKINNAGNIVDEVGEYISTVNGGLYEVLAACENGTLPASTSASISGGTLIGSAIRAYAPVNFTTTYLLLVRATSTRIRVERITGAMTIGWTGARRIYN